MSWCVSSEEKTTSDLPAPLAGMVGGGVRDEDSEFSRLDLRHPASSSSRSTIMVCSNSQVCSRPQPVANTPPLRCLHWFAKPSLTPYPSLSNTAPACSAHQNPIPQPCAPQQRPSSDLTHPHLNPSPNGVARTLIQNFVSFIGGRRRRPFAGRSTRSSASCSSPSTPPTRSPTRRRAAGEGRHGSC